VALPARYGSDRKATAGLEFALIAPVAVVILMMFYDVTMIVIRRWQVVTAADAIARIATTMAATPSGTNSLADTQATTASTAIFGAMPFLLKQSAASYGVAMTSVVMSPTQAGCTSNCTYTGNVAWSLVFLQGTAVTKRPCGTQGRIADGQAPISTALPADAFTSAPILVVDVAYNYVPLITTPFTLFGIPVWFGSSVRLSEAVYVGTRTGNDAAWVRLTGNSSAATAAHCPGYVG
jgi:Flp pilus assembly protein TadG